MSKILASHMLQGNFATEKGTSLKLRPIQWSHLLFFLRGINFLSKESCQARSKLQLRDFADSHKTKGETAIARIGTMLSMVDFSNLCINMDTIITAICSNNEPQPILHQILLNFIAIVNNPDWVCWSENVGSMPLLHWYCYSFLKQIFNCFADFTTDFGNGNIMSEVHPITKLNTSALKSALTVLKAFCSQICLHQATMTAITVMPGSVTAYTISPWNKTQACGQRKDDRNFLTDGASHPIFKNTSTPEQGKGDKRDPTTPDTNKDNPSGHQRQKKPLHGVKVETAAKE